MTEPDTLPFVGELPDNADTWRVYRPEWVTVFAASASDRELCQRPEASLEPEVSQCREHFKATYAGRVRDEDVRVNASVGNAGGIVRLQLYLPNLRAEFITRTLAERHAEREGWGDAVIVERNSAEEHELRAYGVRQLPTGPGEDDA